MLHSNKVDFCRIAPGAILVVVLVFSLFMVASAEAKPRGKGWTNAKYAAIVVDANNDKVLFSRSADAPRYPASLTKIMTLYMLFERIESGKMSLSTRLRVSKHAAGQSPSKLGLKPGSTIDAKTAILALVTKSANDVAVVVAEHLGGSESAFARAMTKKAHELGMKSTTFRNASGLPNSGQKTTARDMARLGQAIMRDFPKQYEYFKTRSFAFRGRYYRNHNRLLGRVKGVDGIKTGYIRASGFNLVSSARRGNRHLVAVVMGGPTGRSRDDHMASLLAQNFSRATTVARVTLPSAPPLPPVRPVRIAEKGITPPDDPRLVARPADTTDAIAGMLAQQQAKPVVLDEPRPDEQGDATPAKPMVAMTVIPKGYVRPAAPVLADAVASVPAPPARAERDSKAAIAERLREQWLIQIGAYNDKKSAHEKLREAQDETGTLRNHLAYTEPVQKNDLTLYRARFAGFDRDAAKNACRELKKAKFSCLPMKQ